MLIDATEVSRYIETPLSGGVLQQAVDWVIDDLTRHVGPVGDGTATTTERKRGGYKFTFTKRRIASVTSVKEYQSYSLPDGVTLTVNTDYIIFHDQGMLQRTHGNWGDQIEITYAPIDDRAQYRQAVIDLTRLFLDRKAFKAEGIAQEMSYTAPDNWEAERLKVIHRLGFVNI